MQRNHLQPRCHSSSRRLIIFIFISLLHFILVSLFAVCFAFFSSFFFCNRFCCAAVMLPMMSLWDCSLGCSWSDVIWVKTVPNSYTIPMTFVCKSTLRNGKKWQKFKLLHSAALGTFSHHEKWWTFFLALVRGFFWPVMTLIITYQRGLHAIRSPVTWFGRILSPSVLLRIILASDLWWFFKDFHYGCCFLH